MRKGIPGKLLVVAGVLLVLSACSDTEDHPVHPRASGKVGLFTIQTEAGPIDVLSFRDDTGGSREIQIHHVDGDGNHLTRTISGVLEPSSDHPGGFTRSWVIRDRDRDLARYTRTHFPDPETGFQIEMSAGEDRVTLKFKPDVQVYRVRYRFERGGTVSDLATVLDPARIGEAGYLDAIHSRLRQIYSGGPLVDGQDLRLMTAVLASPDWEAYLEETPLGSNGKNVEKETRKRIDRTCLAFSATATITCAASVFLPVLMSVCMPSSMMSAGCTLYRIIEVAMNDESSACSCECMCPVGP